MESRGDNSGGGSKGRPAIARRSCDQCRTRKIGCDRGTPCSNCISARLNCTHSAVASNTIPPKQRVLISTQYEQKIDDIAKDIDGIKLLLQGLNVLPDGKQPEANSAIWHLNQPDSVKSLIEHQPTSASGGEPVWDHSADIIGFVKAVVEDTGLRDAGPEANEVLSSLRNLLQTLEGPATIQRVSCSEAKVTTLQIDLPMPPLEAVVSVLRWAKDHEGYTRIAWISRVLPLQKFAEICRKVYFAVDDYSEIDLILTNAYLSHIFSEYVIVSGLQDYREYCRVCRENLQSALSRLPLLLPASMEVIAALTLGSFNAIENSKVTMAWTFISAASNLCQTLGYHRLHYPREDDQLQQAAQERLFWTVHRMEKGLSLRLGRSSNIRDTEITLPIDPNESRTTKLAKIQGKVYDQLYSPAGLSRPDYERGHMAEELAGELRELINETNVEVFDTTSQPSDYETDPMPVVYLQCDLVCESSLLALILRAVPTAQGSLSTVSDDCVAVARDTFDIHQRCIMNVRGCKNDPFMITKYINWAILYCPFVPFNILFTRAVQLLDVADLDRLDRFAASLRPEMASSESITHPYRLYELLCRAIRLYIDSNARSPPKDLTFSHNQTDSFGEFDFVNYGIEAGATANETLEAGGPQTYGLSDWYYGNQQLMSLLDENVMF